MPAIPTKYLILSLIFFMLHICNAQEEYLRGDSTFTWHFGKEVYHPHLWLEDLNSDSTSHWLKKQEEYKFQTFKRADFNRLDAFYGFKSYADQVVTEIYSVRLEVDDYYPPVITIRDKSRGDGFSYKIKGSKFKRHERDHPTFVHTYVADHLGILVTAISHSGGDWLELMVFDLRKMEEVYTLRGVVNPLVYFGKDGFYYERYDIPENETESKRLNQRIVYHKINTKHEEDRVVFYNQDKTSQKTFDFFKSKESKWLIILHPFKQGSDWYEAVSVIDLEDPLFMAKTFCAYKSEFELTFDYVHETGDSIVFRTDMLRPTFQLLKFNVNELNKYRVMVDSYQEVLNEAAFLNDGFYGLEYLHGNKYFGMVIDSLGNQRLGLPLGHGGGINYYLTKKEKKPSFSISHHHLPTRQYDLDLNFDDCSYEMKEGQFGLNYDDFEVVLTEYESLDGVKIPITIIHAKKNFKKNGQHVALMDVYGGYGSIQEPAYAFINSYLLKNGGVLVIPGVRGSGVKGTHWASAGRGVNKQRTIDDIIAASEFLIKEGYTSSELLFLEGGSHGGFAVAASAIQRPDLYRGVIITSGSLDLVRRSNQTTGYSELNRIEYGDPSDSTSFMSRLSLSPIHNLENQKRYPSFLIIGGLQDTRVPIHNSFRFYEALQEKSTNKRNFIHLANGGHDVTNNGYQEIKIVSLRMSFIHELTGIKLWL